MVPTPPGNMTGLLGQRAWPRKRLKKQRDRARIRRGRPDRPRHRSWVKRFPPWWWRWLRIGMVETFTRDGEKDRNQIDPCHRGSRQSDGGFVTVHGIKLCNARTANGASLARPDGAADQRSCWLVNKHGRRQGPDEIRMGDVLIFCQTTPATRTWRLAKNVGCPPAASRSVSGPVARNRSGSNRRRNRSKAGAFFLQWPAPGSEFCTTTTFPFNCAELDRQTVRFSPNGAAMVLAPPV